MRIAHRSRQVPSRRRTRWSRCLREDNPRPRWSLPTRWRLTWTASHRAGRERWGRRKTRGTVRTWSTWPFPSSRSSQVWMSGQSGWGELWRQTPTNRTKCGLRSKARWADDASEGNFLCSFVILFFAADCSLRHRTKLRDAAYGIMIGFKPWGQVAPVRFGLQLSEFSPTRKWAFGSWWFVGQGFRASVIDLKHAEGRNWNSGVLVEQGRKWSFLQPSTSFFFLSRYTW